jgi:hypothetical protein
MFLYSKYPVTLVCSEEEKKRRRKRRRKSSRFLSFYSFSYDSFSVLSLDYSVQEQVYKTD